jgi:hypothetical protein
VNLDLPFDPATTLPELDEYLKEIDRALDAGFMADLAPAFEAASEAKAQQQPPPELAL